MNTRKNPDIHKIPHQIKIKKILYLTNITKSIFRLAQKIKIR